MRPDGLHIHRVERLAAGDEQTVALGASEADIGACFRHTDHADALAAGRNDLHAGARAAPEVAVDVAADAVGGRGHVGAGNIQNDEALAAADRLAIQVPDLDFARAGVREIDPFVIGREANAVGPGHIVCNFFHLPGLAVHAVHGLLDFFVALETLVVAADAVGRVGEPDAAVGMHHDIVGRVEPLALELVRNHRDRAVVFVANHAPAPVLAGKLAALVVESVSVAVAGGIAEHGHAVVVFDPAHLYVVGNVAPHQIAPHAVPGRAFGPQCAEVQAPDDGVADDIAAEALIQRDDVGIGVLDGLLSGPVAWRRHRVDAVLRNGRRQDCAAQRGRKKGASMNVVSHTRYVYRTRRSRANVSKLISWGAKPSPFTRLISRVI